jgi:hypothetical protein
VAAYFTCSVLLKPYLFKYLESSAYDKRRAYHGTALVKFNCSFKSITLKTPRCFNILVKIAILI